MTTTNRNWTSYCYWIAIAARKWPNGDGGDGLATVRSQCIWLRFAFLEKKKKIKGRHFWNIKILKEAGSFFLRMGPFPKPYFYVCPIKFNSDFRK